MRNWFSQCSVLWVLAGMLSLHSSVLLAESSVSSDVARQAFQRPDSIPFPEDNPYTLEKASLGKQLFFDPRLSRDRNLSCASCHNPSFGWEVPFSKAIGAGGKPLGRHAPTVVNLAWTPDLFWDGRAEGLEAQARGPIEADVEMDLPMSVAVERLAEVQQYRDAFALSFPGIGLSIDTVLKAIATYERTIVTGDTAFDQWVRGDSAAMDREAIEGFSLFVGKANCSACHSGWNFTDNRFHDIGLPTNDIGREGVTGSEDDRSAFKTPGLRSIAERAPYMHNGDLATLEAVIAHYIGGGVSRPSRSELIKPLSLNAREVGQLAAFMKALSTPQEALVMPNLPAK